MYSLSLVISMRGGFLYFVHSCIPRALSRARTNRVLTQLCGMYNFGEMKRKAIARLESCTLYEGVNKLIFGRSIQKVNTVRKMIPVVAHGLSLI